MKPPRCSRATKWMKPPPLQEGFELFGTAIGIANAMFVLIFVAHVLGCSYVVALPPPFSRLACTPDNEKMLT